MGVPRTKQYTETMEDWEKHTKSIEEFKKGPKKGIPWTVIAAIGIVLLFLFWGKL